MHSSCVLLSKREEFDFDSQKVLVLERSENMALGSGSPPPAYSVGKFPCVDKDALRERNDLAIGMEKHSDLKRRGWANWKKVIVLAMILFSGMHSFLLYPSKVSSLTVQT